VSVQLNPRLVCNTCGAVYVDEQLQLAIYGRYHETTTRLPKDWSPDAEKSFSGGSELAHGDACFCPKCTFSCDGCGHTHGGAICPCTFCDGTGVLLEDGPSPCPSCAGKDEDAVEDCETCHGEGTVEALAGSPCGYVGTAHGAHTHKQEPTP